MAERNAAMAEKRRSDISTRIIEKAKELGADLAGVADVAAVKISPSHYIYGKLDRYRGVGSRHDDNLRPGEVAWPVDASSVIIIAVEHPEDKPELDWWRDGYSGGTAGNRILMSVNNRLCAWLEEKDIHTQKLIYFIERGGIFLKDAAAVAGLGCIGKNNMLVTPEFGPRVRLRAMLTYEALPPTEPTDFDPCQDCSMPCRKACPQEAFASRIYSGKKVGLKALPARNGVYSRDLCNVQMNLDIDNCKKKGVEGQDQPQKLVRYCRRCEFSCPVGKPD
jgi:epoxyqueuosine reductase